MSAIKVCDGVNWEVATAQTGITRYSEAALSEPANSFLYNLVRSADISGILSMLDDPIGRGKFGIVSPLSSAPYLVVKRSNEPFTNVAINVSLGAGFKNTSEGLETPDYIAYIQGLSPDCANGYCAITLMTKAAGKMISEMLPPDEYHLFDDGPERKEIIKAGRAALRSVGVSDERAYWPDVHKKNVLVNKAATSMSEAMQETITVLDIPSAQWASSFS